jgi:mRNA interferase RelE/StbE
VTFKVRFAKAARKDVASISDKQIRADIVERANRLNENPEGQGKPLRKGLTGLYRVKAHNRWVIMYEVQKSQGVVNVVVVGIRKAGDKNDAYSIAERRFS